MTSPRLALFAYNFVHKKTQDFLTRLHLEELTPCLILAADAVKLDIPEPSIRTKLRHHGGIHPRAIAERLGVRYEVVQHNSDATVDLLREEGIELAVISGARILGTRVIQAVPKGIINFHPGLIPEARGLDAMLWSILEGIPLGVTAHLIDEQVDAGRTLLIRQIRLFRDDTLIDLSERLMEEQLELIRPAIERAIEGKGTSIRGAREYHRKMSPELEARARDVLPAYLESMLSKEPGRRQEEL